MTEKQVKIISHSHDFSTKINLDGATYVIDSEDYGIQDPRIMIRAHLKGKIVYSHEINYEDILNRADFDKRLSDLQKHERQIAIEALKRGKVVPERTYKKDTTEEKKNIVTQQKTYKDYINEVEALIRTNNQKEILQLLIEAVEHYPNNPMLLSYRGYVEALVNRQYAAKVNICKQSLKLLRNEMPLIGGYFLPTLYLNLGRTYLIANKKKEACSSFQKGLEIDNKNEDLFKELKKLGVRRKPFFPFLKRSNPLNKYIGIFICNLRKKTKRT